MFIDIDMHTMDLTGTDPLYKRVRIPFRIYKVSQTLDLGEPVYPSSIDLELKDGTDSYIPYTGGSTLGEANPTAISKAKYEATQRSPAVDFDASLIRDIAINGYTGTEFTLYVSYQALYKGTFVETDDIGPAYSPGLMKSIMVNLSYLNNVLPPIPDITSDDTLSIQVLAEDLTGENDDNYIQDEIHLQINTLANRYVVRPANGSFYKKDLVVKYNDDVLVENEDYQVVGLNLGKTKISSSSSGVYDYILFTKTVAAGVVTLNYRAFGGMVCPEAMNRVRGLLKNIIEYIKLGNFITYDNLQYHPVIVYILERLGYIENMLNISAPVTYTYNATDTDRWVDIAHVSPDGLTGMVDSKGVGHFRIRTEKYFTEIKLNYDLNASDRVLNTHTISSWGSSIEEDSVSYMDDRVCPKFRLLWRSDSINSGLVLQMSLTRKDTKSIFVEMQNSGGSFSNWVLIPTTGTALTPMISSTLLPDNSTWATDGTYARMSNTVIVSGLPYTVFVGNIPIHMIEQHSYTIDVSGDPQDNTSPIQTKESGLVIYPIIVGEDVHIQEVDRLVFKVYDRYTGSTISKVSDSISMRGNVITASTMYYDRDMCTIEAILVRTAGGYDLKVGSVTGSNSLENQRFDLRQIDVIFRGGEYYA